jgi:hypothetical protein
LRKPKYGSLNLNRTEKSSTFSTTTVPFAVDMNGGLDLVRSRLRNMSSYQNITSSAVNGCPSLHFMPRRNWKVSDFPSGLICQLLAICGVTALPSVFQLTRVSLEAGREAFA